MTDAMTPLPSGGRQWSRSAVPLEWISIRLPAAGLAQAREAARWRGIPSSGLVRRAFELGLPLLLDVIAREDQAAAAENYRAEAE